MPDENRVLLIINGDFIDFLTLADDIWFHSHTAVKQLETILRYNEVRPVVQALGQ